MVKFSLYSHIPFCVSKCHYCDFNSLGMGKSPIPETEYLAALLQELGRWDEALSSSIREEIDTVFLGGGTPSLFHPESIASILASLPKLAPLDPSAEVTLELNPKTADPDKMRGFRQAGCDRLSIGVQTLDEALLANLARAHTADDALQAIEWAFAARFERINADLMYGLPRQTMEHVENTLARLAKFPLRHFSAYELIVEEGTPFYDRYLQGRLPLPQTEEVLAMRERIEGHFAARDLLPYEISNYAEVGQESRHNLHYWNYDSFVGIGAGAVSFLRASELAPERLAEWGITLGPELYGLRLTNPRGLQEYQASASIWRGVDVEVITQDEARAEFMMMGLRKSQGVRFLDFETKFSAPFPEAFHRILESGQKRGLLEVDSEACRFSPEGLLLSNEILQEFLPPSLD